MSVERRATIDAIVDYVILSPLKVGSASRSDGSEESHTDKPAIVLTLKHIICHPGRRSGIQCLLLTRFPDESGFVTSFPAKGEHSAGMTVWKICFSRIQWTFVSNRSFL